MKPILIFDCDGVIANTTSLRREPNPKLVIFPQIPDLFKRLSDMGYVIKVATHSNGAAHVLNEMSDWLHLKGTSGQSCTQHEHTSSVVCDYASKWSGITKDDHMRHVRGDILFDDNQEVLDNTQVFGWKVNPAIGVTLYDVQEAMIAYRMYCTHKNKDVTSSDTHKQYMSTK